MVKVLAGYLIKKFPLSSPGVKFLENMLPLRASPLLCPTSGVFSFDVSRRSGMLDEFVRLSLACDHERLRSLRKFCVAVDEKCYVSR